MEYYVLCGSSVACLTVKFNTYVLNFVKGTYIDTTTHKIHNIEVFQTNSGNAQVVERSEIPYTKQTNTYYLAQYNMSVDEGVDIEYAITYTDGIDSLVIFTEHEYAATKGDTVPAYTGVTIGEDHVFSGWYLENDGVIYTSEEIANMTVTEDMTFHAVWTVVPEYTATVEVVLNGTYDAESELHEGALVDLEYIFGKEITIYASADAVNYIPLERKSNGVYSAILENGTYHSNYTGDSVCGGLSMNYNTANQMETIR